MIGIRPFVADQQGYSGRLTTQDDLCVARRRFGKTLHDCLMCFTTNEGRPGRGLSARAANENQHHQIASKGTQKHSMATNPGTWQVILRVAEVASWR